MTDANDSPATDSSTTTTKTGRLLSIDALRGFDMFWIIGGDALFQAIAPHLPTPVGLVVKQQLEHADWEGFRFYDLIFPLFLFLVGVVIPFSLSKTREHGEPRSATWWRIARRTALLFGLGLLCNGILQFDFENLRIAGVLQRIAICYGIAAVIATLVSARTQAFAVVVILVGYWALLTFVAAPGSTAGDLSKSGNLAGYVDRHFLPGKILPPYYGDGDNEGLLSTIPAVATTLIGVLAGHWLRSGRSSMLRLTGLTIAGGLCLLAGYGWGLSFPIIKNLWTSSFVLVTAGWSLLLLALFHAVIDVAGWKRWAFFWVVIGANAITIFVVPRFVDFRKMSEFFLGGIAELANDYGSIVLIAGSLAAKWLFLLYLYRNRIFLRV